MKMTKPFSAFVTVTVVSATLFLANSCAKHSDCRREASAPHSRETSPAPATLATATGTYALVWSDEFDGTAVNTANWNFETGGGGWGNNEQQYYQAKNATVANGELVITAKKERVKANNYTSARLTTQNKRQFTYGRMEARIKLPLGQGLWPAFWMLGSNISTVSWPACGEMDIMEHINTENTIYGTIHWDNNGHAQYGGNTTTTPADYHIYAIEWDATSIRWYLDGVQFHVADITNSINGTDEFHKPFFFILNLAVGGNWPGQTIDNTKLPASMYVDYVRVYQLQ
jgi:beta-glucanase (GH16 family)